MRLIADMINYTVKHVPKWNPTNICSYHLQEAGATPVQELAYALCTAMAILDRVKASGAIAPAAFPQVVERISFFVNAGIRFVEECCKLRAFGEMWDELTLEPLRGRGSEAAPVPLRRAGELARADRGAAGKQRAAHRSGNAGGGAVEARPRPGDPAPGLERGDGPAASLGPAVGAAHAAGAWRSKPICWSTRTFSTARRSSPPRCRELIAGARKEIENVEAQGGIIAAIESGYIKRELVGSHMNRLRAIESGELQDHRRQLLPGNGGIAADRGQRRRHHEVRSGSRARADRAPAGASKEPQRRRGAGGAAVGSPTPRRAARTSCRARFAARWQESAPANGAIPCVRCSASSGRRRASTSPSTAARRLGKKDQVTDLRERVASTGNALGRPLKLLGRQTRAGRPFQRRGAGCRQGQGRRLRGRLRRHPADAATDRPGGRRKKACTWSACRYSRAATWNWWSRCCRNCARAIWRSLPVIVGGIIPPEDAASLVALGVRAVYTPKDFDLNAIMGGHRRRDPRTQRSRTAGCAALSDP